PETTRDEAEAGVVGSTVVFASRNDTTPETHMAAPSSARIMEGAELVKNWKRKPGVAHEMNRMSAATITTSATGGSFNPIPPPARRSRNAGNFACPPGSCAIASADRDFDGWGSLLTPQAYHFAGSSVSRTC